MIALLILPDGQLSALFSRRSHVRVRLHKMDIWSKAEFPGRKICYLEEVPLQDTSRQVALVDTNSRSYHGAGGYKKGSRDYHTALSNQKHYSAKRRILHCRVRGYESSTAIRVSGPQYELSCHSLPYSDEIRGKRLE